MANTILPAGTVRTRSPLSNASGLIIPTFHEYSAPRTITVDGRTYQRDSFDYTREDSGRVRMHYTETPDSAMRQQRAATEARLMQQRRDSW